MATVAESVAIIVNSTGIPESHVKSIARYLIKSGILPKSSGRDIKKISFEEFAKLLLACIVSRSGEGASEDMIEYYNITDHQGQNFGCSAGYLIADIIKNHIDNRDSRFGDVMICLTDKVFEFKRRDEWMPTIRLGSYTPATRVRTYTEIPAASFIEIAAAWRDIEKQDHAS